MRGRAPTISIDEYALNKYRVMPMPGDPLRASISGGHDEAHDHPLAGRHAPDDGLRRQRCEPKRDPQPRTGPAGAGLAIRLASGRGAGDTCHELQAHGRCPASGRGPVVHLRACSDSICVGATRGQICGIDSGAYKHCNIFSGAFMCSTGAGRASAAPCPPLKADRGGFDGASSILSVSPGSLTPRRSCGGGSPRCLALLELAPLIQQIEPACGPGGSSCSRPAARTRR